jgi:hypothetical protein
MNWGRTTIKRRISLIIGSVVVWLTICLLAASLSVYAVEEGESNDTSETATMIPLNVEVNGKIDTFYDMDWFRFELPQTGYISIDFDHMLLVSDEQYWTISIYQVDGLNGEPKLFDWWYISGNQTLSLSRIGLAAGTYFIRVEDSDEWSETPYRLKVNYTAADAIEIERNDWPEEATVIQVDKEYTGAIASAYDYDYYQFTISQKGYITIDFLHELFASDSDQWSIYLYQKNRQTSEYDLFEWWYVAGNQTLNTAQIGLATGTYYIEVTKSDEWSDVPYRLKVNYTVADAIETEPNDLHEEATVIEVGKEYTGTIGSTHDYDWYQFTISNNETVLVHFAHEFIESDRNHWYINIYQSDGETLMNGLTIPGNQTDSVCSMELEAGTYYVKVSDWLDADWVDAPYQLKISNTHQCHGEWTTKINVTCETDGLRERICDVCSRVIEQKTIQAIGHNWGKQEILTAPTCTDSGKEVQTCQVCSYTKERTIEATGHTWGQWETDSAATCTAEGKEVQKCQTCSYAKERTIEAKGHTWSKWEIISGSKLIPPIVREKHCTECSQADRYQDWSYVWITILAVIALIGAVFGMINYVRAYRNRYGNQTNHSYKRRA